jgi:hypothetical protein
MDLEVLSGAPLLDMDEQQMLAAIQQGRPVPAGIPRKRGSRMLFEKQNIRFAAGELNGQRTLSGLTFQSGYKRLAAFALVTRQLNAADTYELALQLSDGTVINMVDQALLASNALTPVVDRFLPLNRAIEQSTATLIINLLGAASGGTALTGLLSAQVVYLLSAE